MGGSIPSRGPAGGSQSIVLSPYLPLSQKINTKKKKNIQRKREPPSLLCLNGTHVQLCVGLGCLGVSGGRCGRQASLGTLAVHCWPGGSGSYPAKWSQCARGLFTQMGWKLAAESCAQGGLWPAPFGQRGRADPPSAPPQSSHPGSLRTCRGSGPGILESWSCAWPPAREPLLPAEVTLPRKQMLEKALLHPEPSLHMPGPREPALGRRQAALGPLGALGLEHSQGHAEGPA